MKTINYKNDKIEVKKGETHVIIHPSQHGEVYRRFRSLKAAERYASEMNTKPSGKMAKFCKNFERRPYTIINDLGKIIKYDNLEK